MLGAPPGEALRQLTAQAVGNPLYLRELIDALVRERALEIGPDAAEVATARQQLPASLAAVLSERLSVVSAGTAQLLRTAALLGGTFTVTDLAVPVDPERDHIRGPKKDALVTLVEYGDFECPYCGQAEPAVRGLIREFGELRFVFRHLPLTEVHPHAQLAAEAAEAAAVQDAFWEMHDLLLDHQGALTTRDLTGYARLLGLDPERFTSDLRKHAGEARIAEDVDSADLSGVSGTPTFFVNGMRHYGAYDIENLSKAVKLALARAKISA